MNVIPTPAPAPSMAKVIRKALIQAILWTASLALAYTAASALAPPYMGLAAPEHPQAAQKAPAPGSPAAIIKRHGCWSGEAPADMEGEVPGHVVTQHGYQGAKAVGQALGQVFGGEDHGLTVYAFCR